MNIDEIKQILADAPEGATHIDSELDYWRELAQDECILMSTQYATVVGQQYPLRSLADLREILELREENKQLRDKTTNVHRLPNKRRTKITVGR